MSPVEIAAVVLGGFAGGWGAALLVAMLRLQRSVDDLQRRLDVADARSCSDDARDAAP